MGNSSGTLSAVQLQTQAEKQDEQNLLPMLQKALHPSMRRSSSNPNVYLHTSLRKKKTIFHISSARGHNEVLKELAECVKQTGTDDAADVLVSLLNKPTSSGKTCLMYACAAGHLETAKLLVSLGASPIAVDKDGNTALHHAARAGQGQCAAYLLELASEYIDVQRVPTSSTVHGSSIPAVYNARRRQIAPPSARQVEALLPILERTSNSSNSISAESSCDDLGEDSTDALCPPPEAPSPRAADSSMSPSSRGDAHMACGTLPSRPSMPELTAQHLSTHRRNSHSRSHSGTPSRDRSHHADAAASIMPDQAVLQAPEPPPFVCQLSSRNRLPCKLVDVQNHWGFTALHLAAATGSVDVAQVLLAGGCNYALASTVRGHGIMSRCPRRSNTLHIAAARGHMEMVRLILQAVMTTPPDVRRPDPRLLRDVEGHQPYMVAGNAGNWAAAQLLISVSRDDTHASWSNFPLPDPQREEEHVEIPKLGVLAATVLQDFLVAQIGQLMDQAAAAGGPALRRPSTCSEGLSRSSSLQVGQSTGTGQISAAPATAPARAESLRSAGGRTRGGSADLDSICNKLATASCPIGPAPAPSTGAAGAPGSRASSLQPGEHAVQAAMAAAALNAAVQAPPSNLATISVTSRHSSEEGTGTCELCYERPRIMQITSCMHSMCASCSKRVVMMGAGRAVPPHCAFCQRPIKGFSLRS